MTKGTLTSTHWGTYRVESENGVPTALHPFEEDPHPSPIGDSMLETLAGPCRIDAPMVRRGFLERGISSDRSARGKDEFVQVGALMVGPALDVFITLKASSGDS